MRTEKIIGWLLVVGVIGISIPYFALTQVFDYPVVLRQPASHILAKVRQVGPPLTWIWWTFAILCLPLLEAYVLMGQLLEKHFYFVRWATTLGIISGIAQILGLMRWVFVVPALASEWSRAGDGAQKAAVEAVFIAVHQMGGVLLGEHIGQLFTIGWTIIINSAFQKLNLFPRWLIRLGYLASAIYLLAQAELFATVIPSFPVWKAAGFIGSTLWLCWLLMTGIHFMKITIPAIGVPGNNSAHNLDQ